jgi:exodeoxyribonuclease III
MGPRTFVDPGGPASEAPGRMKIATWNVNSLRARLVRVLDWLEQEKPDVALLQEVKCVDEQFPRDPIEEVGYAAAMYCQKTYNGVAILSRRPIESVRLGIPGEAPDAQRRVIAAQIDDLLLVNCYVVNGEAVGSEKYAYKLEWMARFAEYVATYDLKREKVIVAGDFNVTFDDRDVYDPERWREKILCSTPEREALRKIMAPGLVDSFRRFHEDAGHYTWWDFRTGGFARDHGLRIDHVLMSEPALAACTGVEIQKRYRGGEKPSDHAPVVATLA